MEKHQRKAHRAWERKKAVEQEKFEVNVRRVMEARARWEIETFAATYTPSPAAAMAGVASRARSLWASLMAPRYDPNGVQRYVRMLLLAPLSPFLPGPRPRNIAVPGVMMDYGGDHHFHRYHYRGTARERLDVSATIALIREDRDERARLGPIQMVLRSLERSDTIREELLADYRRRQAIRNCKILKEEIMMAAWHPRRVEHILTTYGWEAWDNLLGLE